MQRTIQKVLTELSKDKPDLSYIRGLLEGLTDEEAPRATPRVVQNSAIVDDAAILGSKAKSRMDEIKEIANQSITNA